jgi:AmmeMemoRadiSam system protein B
MRLIGKMSWAGGVVIFLLMAVMSQYSRGQEDVQMKPEKELIVRRSWGAGRWFPGQKDVLSNMVNGFMDKASVPDIKGNIMAAIAPHAGYVYSGGVAGHTFAAIRENAKPVGAPDVVVILGFSHRGGFSGVALMDGDAVQTPLGEAALDGESGSFLVSHSSRIRFEYAPHGGEHSAENEIPFVQTALPGVPIVVGLIGDHTEATLEALVDALCGLSMGKRVLVVASTDLLHDADYDRVKCTDQNTLDMIAGLNDAGLADTWDYASQVCCGIGPVLTAMRFARAQGCSSGTVLAYRNSGDDHPESRGNWVVGYGAVVFVAGSD